VSSTSPAENLAQADVPSAEQVRRRRLVAAGAQDLRTAVVRREAVTPTGQSSDATTRIIDTHAKDIDRDTRKVINSVREGVGKGYYAHRATKAEPTESRLDIRVEVAALLRVEGVVAGIEAAATSFVQDQLSKFAVEIKNTTGATRDAYRKVQEQTAAPEAVTIELRANERTATKNGAGEDLPTFDGHIYADSGGRFPAALNTWEAEVITREIARPSFVAWYRNPAQGPYPTPFGSRTAMTPACGPASKSTSSSCPARTTTRWPPRSSTHMATTLPTPRASSGPWPTSRRPMVTEFIRVVSIAKGSDGSLRVLDLLEPQIRQAVRQFDGAKVTALYDSDASEPYH
jgi:hypothetical protein